MPFRLFLIVAALLCWPAIASAGASPGQPGPQDREVRFASPAARIELAGTLSLPPTPGRHPAVVLISGSGPQDRDETVAGQRPFAVLADDLVRRGVVVLRYDDRGVGQSSGDFATATLSDFAADARAAAAFLAGQPEVDPSRIGLIGHSEGGLVAPIVAEQAPGAIAFVVLLAAPAVNGEQTFYLQDAAEARARGMDAATIRRNHDRKARIFEVLKREPDPTIAAPRLREVMRGLELTSQERAELERNGVDLDAMIEQQLHVLNTSAIRVFMAHDPVPLLRRLRIPVLAVIGERDLQVPIEPNLAMSAEALGGPAACARNRVEQLPGLNHLFQTSATGLPSEYGGLPPAMEAPVRNLVGDWILDLDPKVCSGR